LSRQLCPAGLENPAYRGLRKLVNYYDYFILIVRRPHSLTGLREGRGRTGSSGRNQFVEKRSALTFVKKN